LTNQATIAPWQGLKSGEGKPSFIWLHGWGQDLHAFDRLQPLFAATGSHQRFDQPGFGQTPLLFEGASTADYADALASLLMGTGPHIFVGHSFGVRVSIQMAARHPELVQGIIGIAGAGLKRKRSLWFKAKAQLMKLIGQAARKSDQTFGTIYRPKFEARFGSSDYKNAGPLRGTFVKVVNEDLSEQAKATKCPVCLIYGDQDTETPPEFGQRYASLMANARFHQLSGFSHWDIMTRGAYQCEAIMRQFLEETLPK
jgi:pimeloyl-ACP methyl ester carboxylesterase